MAKKRAREADGSAADGDRMQTDGDDSGDDDNFDIVDVDFEWFNFDADIDFHGTKALVRQLLDVDAQLLDMSGLAEVILSQPTIGSTVKVDGKETDPYALMTALNLHEHRDKKPVADLAQYLAGRARESEALASVVPELLQGSGGGGGGGGRPVVGLVMAERLINVPVEIAPPMYTMLVDEIEAAVEDKEPYEFTHYLLLSKTYTEIESALGDERRPKKGKQDKASVFYFHPEDEVLHKHAIAHGSYPLVKVDEAIADSKRAFQEMGIAPTGHMIVIEAAEFKKAAEALSKMFHAPTS